MSVSMEVRATTAGSRLDRWLEWVLRPLIVAGVISLFAVAFYESWSALQKAATEAEIAHPQQWPWSVDGFILVAALVIADGMRSRGGGWWSRNGGGVWWARVLMLAATALSTVIQAIYAPGDFPDGGWWMHAWNAPAVLASFEMLMWLVYGGGQRVERGEGRVGPPDVDAGREAGSAGNRATNPPGWSPASPPQTTTATARDGGSGPGSVEAATLSPPPPSVNRRDETVTALAAKDHAALYRQRGDRDGFERVITARDLDRDAAFALAARAGWPVANGHQRKAPA